MRSSGSWELVLLMACLCLFALSIQLRTSQAHALVHSAPMSFSLPSFPHVHASNDAATNDALGSAFAVEP